MAARQVEFKPSSGSGQVVMLPFTGPKKYGDALGELKKRLDLPPGLSMLQIRRYPSLPFAEVRVSGNSSTALAAFSHLCKAWRETQM